MVTGSGPSFRTDSWMPSGPRGAREIDSRSTGGAPAGRKRSAGCRRTIAAMSRPSSTSGTAAQIQTARLGRKTSLHSLEEAHPAQLGEFALVGVEHELARITEPRLENRALSLAQHHGVRPFGARRGGSRAEHVE